MVIDNKNPANWKLLRYEGDIIDGMMQGEGILHLEDGKIYEGHFDKGKMHGQGKLTYPNGDFFEGQFSDSIPSGICRFTLSDDESWVYEGDILEGKRTGFGKIITQGFTVEGEFLDGKLVGEAALTSPNGCYYIGELKGWIPHGWGKQYLKDGACFEGFFFEGNMIGKIKVTLADGTIKHVDMEHYRQQVSSNGRG